MDDLYGKIPLSKVDDNWGHPYDSGNLHMAKSVLPCFPMLSGRLIVGTHASFQVSVVPFPLGAAVGLANLQCGRTKDTVIKHGAMEHLL